MRLYYRPNYLIIIHEGLMNKDVAWRGVGHNRSDRSPAEEMFGGVTKMGAACEAAVGQSGVIIDERLQYILRITA